jgi:putative salt-induced outer membrane protein
MVIRSCAMFLTVAVASVSAQEKQKTINFTGDVGFVNTAGNTHLTTLSIGDKLTVQAGKVLFTQTFALVYGKSEGVQNANSQLVRARADYALSTRLATYAFVGDERNRFAGIDHRTDEGIGLALAAWKSESDQLDLEAGIGLVQQHLLPDPQVDLTVSDNFVAGRAAARFKHAFSKATYFQQTLEFLPNLETTSDYRLNSETALVAPISAHFGLKASYVIKYNHAPPSLELAKSDRMLTTSVQVSY